MSQTTLPIILIPSYKPDEKLVHLTNALVTRSPYHLLIIDDGNQDLHSQQLFQQLEKQEQVTVVHHATNKGKGAALKTGISFIQEQFPNTVGCITADADGQHLVDDIIKVACKLELEPTDFMMGTREFNSKTVPFRSRFGNQLTAKLFKLVTGITCYDTQTGLRGIPSTEFSSTLQVPGERFEFEMNQLLDFAKRKVPIQMVPIHTVYIEENKSSHFNPLKDSLRIMNTLLLFGIASSIGTIVDLVVFFLLTQLLPYSASSILISSIIARLISGIVNYSINVKWVFKTTNQSRFFAKYVLLFIVLLFTSSTLVTILTPFANPLLIKITIDSLLFIASYNIQQNYVFVDEEKRLSRKDVNIWHG